MKERERDSEYLAGSKKERATVKTWAQQKSKGNSKNLGGALGPAALVLLDLILVRLQVRLELGHLPRVGFGFRVSGLGIRVSSVGFRVSDFEFWVWVSGEGLGVGVESKVSCE